MNSTDTVRGWRKLGPLVAGGLLLAAPFAASSAELDMLASLTKGAWDVRVRDDRSQRRICLRDGQELIQIRHREAGCSRFVVRDDANELVVQYTCRGNGYGRTSLRRESNGLVQIESQGILDGTPFAISGEARYAGSC